LPEPRSLESGMIDIIIFIIINNFLKNIITIKKYHKFDLNSKIKNCCCCCCCFIIIIIIVIIIIIIIIFIIVNIINKFTKNIITIKEKL